MQHRSHWPARKRQPAGARDQHKALAGWSRGRRSPAACLELQDIPHRLAEIQFVGRLSPAYAHTEYGWPREEYFVAHYTIIHVLVCLHMPCKGGKGLKRTFWGSWLLCFLWFCFLMQTLLTFVCLLAFCC